MKNRVVPSLIYWRALELAGIGHLSELTRLILRGDRFPAEYEHALAAFMSGERRPRRRRDLKLSLNFMEAPVARHLFNALTSEYPKDADKQARRFVRAVTRESLNEANTPNGKPTGERPAAGGAGLCSPQVARSSPPGVEDTARMSKVEAIARTAIIFACTEGAAFSAARLDKDQVLRPSPQHWTPRPSAATRLDAPIVSARVGGGSIQPTS